MIQILPTVLSITMIALFAFPEMTKYVKKKITKCIKLSIVMIVIFFFAIGMDFTVLMGLEYYYENVILFPLVAICLSGFAIFYLYMFMAWVLIEYLKSQ